MKRGVFVAILVLVLVLLSLVLVGGYIYMQLTAEPYVPEKAVLRIRLGGPVAESVSSAMPGLGSPALAIRDLWFQLERAALDPRIRGIQLKISGLNAGFAKVEEIGGLLRRFRRSGKPVVAFIEDGGLRELYLATFADKVTFFKGGILYVSGIAAEAMFLRHTLAKLGVQADIYHIGEYKTATNMYTEDRMTPPHRESLQALIQDIHDTIVAGLARNRRLGPDAVRRLIEESPLPMEDYLKAGLVDRIGYEDDAVRDIPGELPAVEFGTYADTTSPVPFRGEKKVAVIFASGEINTGASGGESLFGGDVLGSDTLAEQLRRCRKSGAVKAVVLRVDSPGGSAAASDVILREAELLAQKKPLVVSMSDVAASGGYWISLAAKTIVAQPQTITGSIGVIFGKFVLKGLYDKIGVTKEMVRTSPYAGMYSDYQPFSPAEKQKVLSEMQRVYAEFLGRVARSRGMREEDVDRVGRGRVWSGTAARRLNLVNQFGGLPEAMAEARRLARIPESEKVGVLLYPRKRSLLDLIFQAGGLMARQPLDIEARLRAYQRFYPASRLPFLLTLQ